MGLFSKKKKDTMTLSQLKVFDKKAISYVVQRLGGEEKLLGRQGAISVTDDNIVIVCNGKEALRLVTGGAVIAELLSGNGAVIKGFDEKGTPVHAIAYYSNLRQ